MIKASGRRRHSGAEQLQQPNQWTSLTVDQGEDTKTSKKEEEMRQDTSEFVTGTDIQIYPQSSFTFLEESLASVL